MMRQTDTIFIYCFNLLLCGQLCRTASSVIDQSKNSPLFRKENPPLFPDCSISTVITFWGFKGPAIPLTSSPPLKTEMNQS